MIVRKSPREIELMRVAGKITAGALRLAKEIAKKDVTTDYLNTELEKYIINEGGIPIFKGYRGFPKSICASINEEVVHGIPGSRKLKNGDILSIDVGVGYRKYVADAALTIPIGEITAEARHIIDVCEKSLYLAINVIKANEKLSLISRTIQDYVERNGYSVIRNYTGHGIGRCMHEDPQVPNFVSKALLEADEILMQGVTIAIEPMICQGNCDTEVLNNKWTVVTKDRKLSAHFEHSVVVTDDGVDILTL
ncbi:MAG: type I methionyl aminopeptidase [Candidatus Brocadia sp. AMX2]|uniref:Methionine aminopeptidase n=1 Tax=Candidatus Brocadia sinica JPN1 TaxID=1197129 RepID=A0ABQ0JY70_9BACT|nr:MULTISPECIES: type I methionyl aminopeptidase [Brocadia]MBC6932915.1 type I methionyl aminopeptidase [Candidatus Brocadia sp.]MBL1167599.1 type I methionyl aminopeptidase [Candidatus Brocadia sp. AMX1]NOG40512.1 type I methionyl aminopeptidase [Planctomycetota bacterium]GIK13514.1 MAG: type I methionyl aminopeptidase [Candidatus Brocadia sinica]KAA0242060.1 MAG: type I methionyl aminopeptidase [Candidatus Brocadia sp. AMX2]